MSLRESAETVSDDEFAEFARAELPRARRLAWRLLGGDETAAEDVVQNAFVKAARARGAFRREASLSTWFYRIVVREAQSHRRWRAVRDRFAAHDRDPDERAGDVPVGDPALRRRLSDALESLSAMQRQVFVLMHLEGFTATEAAALIGRSEGTAKTHLHRALKGLRAALSDAVGAPGTGGASE